MMAVVTANIGERNRANQQAQAKIRRRNDSPYYDSLAATEKLSRPTSFRLQLDVKIVRMQNYFRLHIRQFLAVPTMRLCSGNMQSADINCLRLVSCSTAQELWNYCPTRGGTSSMY